MATQISSQYLYTSRGPFDSKQLIQSKSDLINAATWSGYQYNGMIVAVADKDNTSANGIYYFFDKDVKTARDTPNVTVEANWHKLCTLSELTALDVRLQAIEAGGGGGSSEDLAELQESLATLQGLLVDGGYIEESGGTYAAVNLDSKLSTAIADYLQSYSYTKDDIDDKVNTIYARITEISDTIYGKDGDEQQIIELKIATEYHVGGIKSSTDSNTISVDSETGVATVNKITTDKLANASNHALILDGGTFANNN